MNILFTICARAGSKGVAGKNVRLFCGKPIVYYTLEIYRKFLEKNKDIRHEIILAVNTDSEQLLQQINNSGIEYVYVKRKAELAGDVTAKGDVIKDTLCEVEKMNKQEYGLVVDLDITSPLRNLSDIEGTINQVLENEKCNFAYSVVKSRRNPYFNMVCKNEQGFFDRVIPSNYTARQQVPECFDMNASIYVYAKDYLLDMCMENRFALIWEMPDSAVLDIDNENDFEVMEILLKYYWEHERYLDIKIC